MSNATIQIAKLVRKIAGNFVFRKALPSKFGHAKINVTSRSDIRLLVPGFERSVPDLLQVASRYIEKGNCVWDLGSNLGIFSFCASWMAGVNGKVYSLEADSFYAELQHKTASSLPPRYAPVIPLCAAVADSVGILELAISKRGHSRNHLSMIEGNCAGETEARKQVVSVTADFLLQHWPRPDFIKVDVEGAEILFLRGATELLKVVRPIFYIEVNDENRDSATEILISNNYRLFSLSKDGAESATHKCNFNTIAKPEEYC